MLSLAWFYWDPKPEVFVIPGLNWPILWYGVFFTLGFGLGFFLFVDLLTRFLKARGQDKGLAKQKAVQVADQLTLYLVIATIVGARVGHFVFYENPSDYLSHPLDFFRIWEGGLASHGAVIAILFAVFLFSRRIRTLCPELGGIDLLDLLAPPAAFASACIRFGNFCNQEILGTPTDLPWAVIFGHPLDHSLPTPRHPVQIYEALFYLLVFFWLFFGSRKESFLLQRGKRIGSLLVLIFGFRFFIEFFKEEQSRLVAWGSPFTMGQLLSVPLVLLGIFFLMRGKKR